MKSKRLLLSILLPVYVYTLALPNFSHGAEPIVYSWDNYDNWYYKKSVSYKGWKYIVIHHSATSAGSVKAFHKFHTQQGYGGIAYHFVIGNGNGMKDGEVKETFRWEQQISGTHVSVNSWEYNVFGIGICLVGNLEKSPPTKSQITALNNLIARLKTTQNIRSQNILGHRHVKYDDASDKKEQTVCPGKKLDIDK